MAYFAAWMFLYTCGYIVELAREKPIGVVFIFVADGRVETVILNDVL